MSTRANILKWSGIALLAVALLLAFLIALIASLDWNHARPWINQRVSAASGRPFAINGDLSVTWEAPPASVTGWRRWVPWPHVEARDITVGNPSWVEATPYMAKIRALSATVAPWPLLRKEVRMAALRIDTPRLHLQRTKDNVNNWTFGKQDDKPSAWQVLPERLQIEHGTLRLIDGVRSADVRAQVDSAEDGGIGWKLAGALSGAEVDGSGKAGRLLSLREKGTAYPVDAELRVGKTALSAHGTLTNPQALAALDLQLKISGVSMSHLHAITGIVLPDTPAYSTEGHLSGTFDTHGGHWHYEKFKGKVGSSDIAGSFEYVGRATRPLLKGDVSSQLLRFDDLAPLIGADSNINKVRRGAAPVQPQNKALPVEKFSTGKWTSVDADVRFSGRRILRNKELPIDNLVTDLHLKDGVLTLAPLNFGVAGGTLTSTITLDGNADPAKAEMKISARRLQLKRLFPGFEPMKTSLGQINGDASLSATGDSIAELLGSSNGEIKALIDRGTISKLLLEAMGLNIGNVVLATLFGDRQVELNCLASDFKVAKGVMTPRMFLMDTDDATINIGGTISLAQEKLDLVIKPESKGVRVISLRSPLYVTGSFKKPDVQVDKGVLALKAGSAIALGVVAPVATALLPLVNMGPGKDSPCGALLAQANRKPVAPPPGKTAAK
jgi:AsmA family protein